MITPAQLYNKHIEELTLQELAFVHLDRGSSPILVKDAMLRSTLSFTYENIQHGLAYDKSKDLMPYFALCAVLDQLGVCYDRADKPAPRFENGIKRALVLFGEFDEDDETIETLYALRNGLLHNISLTSFDRFKGKYYCFAFGNIAGIYEKSDEEWDGNYDTLDGNSAKYTTRINREKFKELVWKCVDKANELNQNSQLSLRLAGGLKQLFYDYIRAVPLP